MIWILGGLYCLIIWLVFDKLRLLRLSLPMAAVLASIGPGLIIALLFCAQYFHPYTSSALVIQKTVPITPQISTRVRVTRVVAMANTPLESGDILFEVDRAPLEAVVDQANATEREAQAGVKVAEAAVVTGKASLKRAEAELEFLTRQRERMEKLVKTQAVTEEEYERTLAGYQQAASALEQARAELNQATLGVELAKTKLSKAEVALRDAKYDLDQSVVVAPAKGYITNVQLRPGALVGGPGSTSVMTFVETTETDKPVVVATFTQKNLLLIKPGQYSEVILDAHPGQVFLGKVLNTIEITGGGQLMASGDLPETLPTDSTTRFAVRIALEGAEGLHLLGGATGQAAVYTQNVQVAGIPVMFLIRAKSWLNYLL